MFEEIVVRNLLGELLAEEERGLVGPAPRDVADRVAAAAQDQRRQVEAPHKLHELAVPLDRKVEAPQPVARERARAAPQHDGLGPVYLHDLRHDGLEDALVRRVVHAVFEREVDGVALAGAVPDVVAGARAREVRRAAAVVGDAVLVEGARHDAVRRVERLLDAVAVVDVDVDVQHALVPLQQLQNAEHAVVHVAEARRLGFFRVVQAAGPVDDDVGPLLVQPHRAADGPRRVELAEFEEPVEDGAVLAHVEALELPQVLVHVVGRDDAEEIDVVVRVEPRHERRVHGLGPEHLHHAVEPVVHHEVVRHPHAVRLHRVALAVVEVSDLRVVEVRDASSARSRHGSGSLRGGLPKKSSRKPTRHKQAAARPTRARPTALTTQRWPSRCGKDNW
mmetsp:Transcript_22235/g.68622  ORF Transcript_22235/g.68622 Transcript_22235/m.68622 type:complete len:392 (+) Transcript_22235:358-1533(+)